MENPIVSTSAYKIVSADKAAGALSHAYLVVCADESMLESYLTELSKLIVKSGDELADAKVFNRIEKKIHPDVVFYPKDKKLSVADADDIVAQSVVKPMELNLRVFVAVKFEELNQYQNKLLKTLEEPPKNVIILMGAVNESAVLATVKSRSKILNIPPFSDNALKNSLKTECRDEKKLDIAIALSDGRLGEALRYYNAEDTEDLFNYCLSVMEDMNKAKDVLTFADKMRSFAVRDVIAALKVICGGALSGKDDRYKKLREAFRPAVFIGITEKLNKSEKAMNFNANATMLIDGILFAVMEEKAEWQRLSV